MTYSDIEEDIPSEVRDPSVEYKTAVESEFNAIRELSLSAGPQLHGGSELVPTILKSCPEMLP
jgi:hypothetical protein